MDSTICDPDALQLWRDRPGHISRALSNAVIFACVVTVMVAAFGGHFLWEHYRRGEMDAPWAPAGPPLFALAWISATALPGGEVARLLRVAVLLPVAHLVAMIATWVTWHVVTSPSHFPGNMLDVAPIGAVVCATVAVLALLAWLIARGRRGEAIHAFAMLALALLLVFGLWLPLASWIAWHEPQLDLGGATPVQTLTLVFAPPLALATAFTAIAFRRPALHARGRWVAGLVVAGLLGLVIATKLGRADNPYGLFGSLIHVAFALAFVAAGALVALGAVTWLRARRARAAFATGALTGTVGDDGDADIGCFEIASWLRGPRAVLQPFTVVTAAGRLLIHGGAQLVAPVPAATTQLRVGESLVGLRAGDAVVIAGLEAAGGASPYRGLGAPLGSGGVLVGRAGQRYGFAHVALTVWRPCVAYLVILLVVGVPGLLAAGAFR